LGKKNPIGIKIAESPGPLSMGFFFQGDLILRIEPVETEIIFDFALLKFNFAIFSHA